MRTKARSTPDPLQIPPDPLQRCALRPRYPPDTSQIHPRSTSDPPQIHPRSAKIYRKSIENLSNPPCQTHLGSTPDRPQIHPASVKINIALAGFSIDAPPIHSHFFAVSLWRHRPRHEPAVVENPSRRHRPSGLPNNRHMDGCGGQDGANDEA